MSNGRCEVCDAVNADDPRLKLDWKMKDQYISNAKVGMFELRVVCTDDITGYDGTQYIAYLFVNNAQIHSDGGYNTRLKAQIAAERLLHQLHHLINFARKGVDASEQFKKKDKGKDK